jgi:hypothetical protein
MLPKGGSDFDNPFDHSLGQNNAYEYQSTWTAPLTTSGKRGIVCYGDSLAMRYQIVGHGASADLAIDLTSGQ